jgi:type IV secretory pathway VirB2 component (pilin)
VLGTSLVAVLIAAGITVAVGRASSPMAPNAALQRVLHSLKGDPGNAIVSARIAKHGPPGTKLAVPALSVRAKIPSGHDGESTEALWQANLLTGAVVELAGSSPWLEDDIGYINYTAQVPNGKVVRDLGGGMGADAARGQRFAGSNDTAAEVRDYIERHASRLGLTVDSVTVFHALGAAPAVVLTVPSVQKAIANGGAWQDELFGSPPRYEGYYLELRRKTGKPFARRGYSFLTGDGLLWIDPSLGVPLEP